MRDTTILERGYTMDGRDVVTYITRVVVLGCGLTIQKREFCFISRLCNHRLPDRLQAIRFLNSDGKFTEFAKEKVT